MRKILVTALAGLAMMATSVVAATSAEATPILDVVGGELRGATDVDVDGTLYDVIFIDGTCIAVFDGCADAVSDFAFSTEATAILAAVALLDQVFLDGPGGLDDDFDTDPTLTRGCESAIECIALIPYFTLVSFSATAARNFTDEAFDNSTCCVAGSLGADTGGIDSLTWAVFSLSPSRIPEPGTLAIFGLGLLGMAATRRRRRRTA